MKELHIDIETRSSADLARCGVYRYAESPDYSVAVKPPVRQAGNRLSGT